jgi:Tfp pilus assembly protein FimT
MAVPSLKTFAEGTKLRTAARSIRSLLEFARSSAISERTEYVVLFDSTNRQYWLSLKAFLNETQGGTLTDSSRTNLTESLANLAEQNSTSISSNTSNSTSQSNNQNAVVTRTGGILGMPKDLPIGVEIVMINSPRSTGKNSSLEYVNFYPDSRGEDFEVYLQSSKGKVFLLSVSEATARTGIRELTNDEIEQIGLTMEKSK